MNLPKRKKSIFNSELQKYDQNGLHLINFSTHKQKQESQESQRVSKVSKRVYLLIVFLKFLQLRPNNNKKNSNLLLTGCWEAGKNDLKN